MAGTSHVLARKYRPMTFADLIGQEALVQTVRNAILNNRLPQAYMLTGIRGVGKTTSARIIAKGLNCIGPDGTGGMTPNPCGQCRHCRDIAADAHMDVIEIDAASNTGVDNVREIIEGAKYNPVSARFKVYIIDEVHMLSKQAFNALLKTLEEPPERIKFIFATTEIRKVPVTILSRCQRFDLKRVSEEELSALMTRICAQEGVTADEAALRLIARAGDGSVRDSLSLLDQAMTQLDSNITADGVRHMLGTADQGSLFDLFEALMRGDIQTALSLLKEQYDLGADPLTMAQDLLDVTHQITRFKLIPDLLSDVSLSPTVRTRGKALAENLTMASLTGAWQMMLKGIGEIKQADYPLKALEMVLIRWAYLSDMPPLDQLIRDAKKKPDLNAKPVSVPAERSDLKQTTALKTDSDVTDRGAEERITSPKTVMENTIQSKSAVSDIPTGVSAAEKIKPDGEVTPVFREIKDISDLARRKQERILAFNIDSYIRPVAVQNGLIVCGLAEETPRSFTTDLVRFLNDNTPFSWQIKCQQNVQAKTRKEDLADRRKQLYDDLKKHSVVAEVLAQFPGAAIDKVKERVFAEEPVADGEGMKESL